MDPVGSPAANREYYDAFAPRYEARRGKNDPGGYHDLLDELESDLVARYGAGRDVLEVGCGTGLVLERIGRFARVARGVDLSPGMLELARERGLDVCEGSATELPFEDESFDVTCSFKVLPHIKEIELAMHELVRVTRRGGVVIAELYNPHSLRGLAKRLGGAGLVAPGRRESDVYTRFDTPEEARGLVPPGCATIATRGIRIVTPAAGLLRVPVLGAIARRLEWWLADSRLRYYGGFWVMVLRRF